jgi:hypothetical protein
MSALVAGYRESRVAAAGLAAAAFVVSAAFMRSKNGLAHS